MSKRKRITVIFVVLASLIIGYHAYCHYMVTQLYKYIDAGDMDKAMECIEKMPDVNTLEMCQPLYSVCGILTMGTSMTGYPLYYAVSHKADISVIRALLEQGADPDRIDIEAIDRYPLYYICVNPSKDMYEKVMLLAEYGADPHKGNLYITGHWAERSEETKESMFLTIKYLWENGAEEVRGVGRHECTVLHEAAERMDIEYFQELYNNDIRPMKYLLNEQDANGETALFCAIRAEMFDNCNFLIAEGIDVSIQNNEGKTAYDIAEELGYIDEIEGL